MTRTKPTVIALCSPVMASGKSAAAQHLVEEHGFALVKFAGPLKDMTRALLPHLGVDPAIVENHVEGGLKESLIDGHGCLTTRYIMQTLGTEWGRQTVRPDFWTHIAATRCRSLLDAGSSVVIDDMRFPNELETVLALGGRPYRIVRPGLPVPPTNHASEGGLDAKDMLVLRNDGTLDDLRDKLDAMVETH